MKTHARTAAIGGVAFAGIAGAASAFAPSIIAAALAFLAALAGLFVGARITPTVLQSLRADTFEMSDDTLDAYRATSRRARRTWTGKKKDTDTGRGVVGSLVTGAWFLLVHAWQRTKLGVLAGFAVFGFLIAAGAADSPVLTGTRNGVAVFLATTVAVVLLNVLAERKPTDA